MLGTPGWLRNRSPNPLMLLGGEKAWPTGRGTEGLLPLSGLVCLSHALLLDVDERLICVLQQDSSFKQIWQNQTVTLLNGSSQIRNHGFFSFIIQS